jgi:alkylhydroperoxidase/carboxymuconolactone decarboxylase family protein YurZ
VASDIDEQELRRWLMGDDEVKQRNAARNRSSLARPHAELMTEASTKLWDRRVLDLKTMALVNLGILTALNHPYEVRLRIRGLLCGGVRPEEIAEVLLQTAFYCGNPQGVEALVMLVDAVDDLRELGLLVHEPEGDLPTADG